MLFNMSEQFSVSLDGAEKTLPALSDDELMEIAASDNSGAECRAAFETLVTRHQSLVLGLAVRFLGSREKGRDVTQDVFLSLWAERESYRPEGKFRSYLASVCLNRCRVVTRTATNRGRKHELFGEDLKVLPDTGESEPLDTLIETERRNEIQQYLTRLSPQCRQVMIHRFTQDMPLAEIAEIAQMPIGTVKSHVQRGLEKIRMMMKKEREKGR